MEKNQNDEVIYIPDKIIYAIMGLTFYKLRHAMLSIYLLIPLSLMLFVIAIWAIYYAVKSNQFEDLDNASEQIILDDRQARRKTKRIHKEQR